MLCLEQLSGHSAAFDVASWTGRDNARSEALKRSILMKEAQFVSEVFATLLQLCFIHFLKLRRPISAKSLLRHWSASPRCLMKPARAIVEDFLPVILPSSLT